jgi:spore maturation protein CgeB
LKSLIDSGVNLKIYGPDWVRSPYYNYLCSRLGYKIKPLNSNDYNLALNSSKIALVFLSKLNNDTYTRRCFEIPATKSFMLSQYSEDLSILFKDGIEAVYFNSYIDLKHKIEYYLFHDNERKKIAEAGYNKLISDGHEASDRADDVINKITLLLNEK